MNYKETNLLENKLSIIITTYNRADLLKKTFEYLKESPIRKCRITVLNNKSTDNTLDICESYRQYFTDFTIITHPVNLGGGCENYIHAIDYCDTEYMWILADDDEYDFSYFEDVTERINESDVDLIQVGAHNDCKWDWGIIDTPRNLCNMGYNYFKYSSFLPCTIFKYDFFCKYIKQAYDYIHYRYPHMPCLVKAYECNSKVYLSKHRIVYAIMGNQAYSSYIPIKGFAFVATMLKKRKQQRIVMSSQYNKNLAYCFLVWTFRKFIPNTPEGKLVKYLIYSYCSTIEKLIIILLYFPVKILSWLYSKK